MMSICKVGTILTQAHPLVLQALGMESEPWDENWKIVKGLDSSAFNRKVNAGGWNSFLIGAERKAMFFGTLNAEKIRSAVKRILAHVQDQRFNGLEITNISSRHLLGISYVVVSAYSRHIQENCFLGNASDRIPKSELLSPLIT